MKLIDADALWTDIMMLPHNGDMISSEEVEQAIKDAPAVEAVEVVHSSWGEGIFNTKGEYEEQCLNCKMFSSACGCDYCPNCGAKMDGRKDNEA